MKRISLVFLCIFCTYLSGCSSLANSSSLRNRNFDYARVEVENLNQPLKTPANLTTPAFNPRFIIPAGQNDYLPTAIGELTPPGYTQVYEIPPVKIQPAV